MASDTRYALDAPSLPPTTAPSPPTHKHTYKHTQHTRAHPGRRRIRDPLTAGGLCGDKLRPARDIAPSCSRAMGRLVKSDSRPRCLSGCCRKVAPEMRSNIESNAPRLIVSASDVVDRPSFPAGARSWPFLRPMPSGMQDTRLRRCTDRRKIHTLDLKDRLVRGYAAILPIRSRSGRGAMQQEPPISLGLTRWLRPMAISNRQRYTAPMRRAAQTKRCRASGFDPAGPHLPDNIPRAADLQKQSSGTSHPGCHRRTIHS